jgi:4-alpha-glucanotransferase
MRIWEVTLDLPDTRRPKRRSVIISFAPSGWLRDGRFRRRPKTRSGRPGRGHTVVIDSWNDLGAVENVFSTEPFKNVLLRTEGEAEASAKPPGRATHSFNVKAPLLPKGQTICLLGSAGALGGWNQAAPVLLRRDAENGCFSAQLDLANESFPVTYKYGVYDLEKKAFVRYEDGAIACWRKPPPQAGR